jgi:hypothetical protein
MKKMLLSLTCAALLAAGTAAHAQVYVRIGPPPPAPREVVPPPPHPGYVWRPGYHRWDGARYVWVPGNYAAPPRPHAYWAPGHWRNTPRGYVWAGGHWR